MRWAAITHLQWLWFVAGCAIFFVFYNWYRARAVRRFGDQRLVKELISSLSPWKRFLKLTLMITALALAVFALGQPERPGKTVRVARTGMDIVIAVDVSLSMLTEDVQPSRIEKAKLELQEFVEKAEGDRIGVIAFAGDAHIQVPLTLDRDAAKLFLKTLSPRAATLPGTSLERAIRLSWGMFDDDQTEGKVLILLTDGENHEGNPIEAAKLSKEHGINIYAIGIGTPKGEAIPVRRDGQKVEFKKDLRGKLVVSRLDEQTLKHIAEVTGGIYYRTQKGNLRVDRIYKEIRQLAKKETGTRMVKEFDPLYHLLLLPAVILLGLELMLSERKGNLG